MWLHSLFIYLVKNTHRVGYFFTNIFEKFYSFSYTIKMYETIEFPFIVNKLENTRKGLRAVIKQDLTALIENKRMELIKVANVNGFTSSVALRCSQELDHLINEYNRRIRKKIPS